MPPGPNGLDVEKLGILKGAAEPPMVVRLWMFGIDVLGIGSVCGAEVVGKPDVDVEPLASIGFFFSCSSKTLKIVDLTVRVLANIA